MPIFGLRGLPPPAGDRMGSARSHINKLRHIGLAVSMWDWHGGCLAIFLTYIVAALRMRSVDATHYPEQHGRRGQALLLNR